MLYVHRNEVFPMVYLSTIFDATYIFPDFSQIINLSNRKWKWKLLSHDRLSATPWTIESMEFSRPEYWSR